MSGGAFNYVQYQFGEVAEDIRRVIKDNNSTEKDEFGFGEVAEDIRRVIKDNNSTEKDEFGDTVGRHLPADIIAKFEETAATAEKAARMVTRVDWLLSGDDGEDSFRRRWIEEDLG